MDADMRADDDSALKRIRQILADYAQEMNSYTPRGRRDRGRRSDGERAARSRRSDGRRPDRGEPAPAPAPPARTGCMARPSALAVRLPASRLRPASRHPSSACAQLSQLSLRSLWTDIDQ